ncbi:outer membrane receptor protein involved in Fe transport [Gelidibacter algens]|uniref:Outer membrane receptor protein involved in Fe transport n=1 Tax=Gelidibacter algens TaxID=49280 RepID=A0A1A7R531_9FLAO|nr:outer membrane beta-barrel family protein [Gelidibacter algens]OBX26608.1 glucosamine-6-phosphate deaminase [Gelidibacter algens]RAJ25659.1 outer membrane receptor protein involved in Fe transport [Gelidibacter algens]
MLGFAQDNFISGAVADIDGQPIAFANVILMNAQDSSLVRGISTNEKGFFILDKILENKYLLKLSFIGYTDIYKSVLVNQSIQLGTIILEESSQELDEVNILVKRPTLKKEADRLVFNIENTALIEGNMFQVLKNTPGILVLNNTIQVKNSTPTVYINDKRVHLNTAELIQLLEGSSANNIKSVEVITNPSAKYDASSGTVINIVMSKNLITGYRGNVFANFTQGVFPRYNPGTSHFFKNDKIDFFANYSYSQDKINRDQNDVVNYLDGSNAIDQIFKSNTNRNTWSKTHNLNFNFDYALNENNTLSLSSNMLVVPYFEYKINNTTNVFDANQNLEYFFDANNFSDDDKYNLGFDLDYVHKFKNEGEKLSVNFHFTTFNYSRNQDVKSTYFDTDGSFLETTAFRTDNHQDTEIYTAKVDYMLPLSDISNLELGAKGINIRSSSNITQFDVISGTETIDPNNTDAFDYDETNFAGYVNFSTDWEKLSLVTGLRAEQTNVKSNSLADGMTKTQDYLEWFPTASLNYSASDKVSVYTNYKRSIQRPNYQNLNPFQFYLNDFNIVTGNPNLQPVIVDHAVLGTSLFRGTYTVEAYYKTYTNNIFELPFQDNTNTILIYTPVNLSKTIEFGFDFITYFYVMDNWSLYFVTSFFNTKDEAEFDGMMIDRDLWSNYSVLSNDFTFLKDQSLNVNFNLTYLSKSMSGLREIKDILQSELTISKSILKDKGSISLVVADLFNTQNFDISSRFLNQNSSVFYDQDTRFIKLGFRYKFGNTNLETNQRSKSQQETERLEKQGN